MKYKYKINYKSIGGSSSTSSSTSSNPLSPDNTSGSTTFDNKIEYIDNIMDNLSYEGNIHLIDTWGNFTPIKKGKRYDPIKKIKEMWEKSIENNSNDRIKQLFEYLIKNKLIIKEFNMFDNEYLKSAVNDWIYRNDQAIKVYKNISDWDTSYVTSMSYLFAGRENFD